VKDGDDDDDDDDDDAVQHDNVKNFALKWYDSPLKVSCQNV
jgi:hypothetical protein